MAKQLSGFSEAVQIAATEMTLEMNHHGKHVIFSCWGNVRAHPLRPDGRLAAGGAFELRAALKQGASSSYLDQGVQPCRPLLAVLLGQSGEARNIRAHTRGFDKECLRL